MSSDEEDNSQEKLLEEVQFFWQNKLQEFENSYLESIDSALGRAAKEGEDRLIIKDNMINCDHGVVFDISAAEGLSSDEVRSRWPRLWGNCPKGCGFKGIGYASFEHYICGDW